MPNLPEPERPETSDAARPDTAEIQIHLRQAIERAEHLRKQTEEAEKRVAALRELMDQLNNKW